MGERGLAASHAEEPVAEWAQYTTMACRQYRAALLNGMGWLK